MSANKESGQHPYPPFVGQGEVFTFSPSTRSSLTSLGSPLTPSYNRLSPLTKSRKILEIERRSRKDAEEVIARQKDEIDTLHKKVRALDFEVDDTKLIVREKEHIINEKDLEIRRQKHDIQSNRKTIQDQIEVAELIKESLQGEMDEKSSRISELCKKNQELKKEAALTNDVLKEKELLESEVQSLKGRVSELDDKCKANCAFIQKCRDLETDLMERDREILDLQRCINELTTTNEQLLADELVERQYARTLYRPLRSEDISVDEVSSSFAIHTPTKDGEGISLYEEIQTQYVNDFNVQIQELKDQLASQTDTINQLSFDLDEKTNLTECLQSDINYHKEKVARFKNTKCSLEDELCKLKATSSDQINNLQIVKESMESQIEHLKSEVDSISSALVDTEGALDASQAEAKTLVEQNKQLNADKIDITNKYDAATENHDIHVNTMLLKIENKENELMLVRQDHEHVVNASRLKFEELTSLKVALDEQVTTLTGQIDEMQQKLIRNESA